MLAAFNRLKQLCRWEFCLKISRCDTNCFVNKYFNSSDKTISIGCFKDKNASITLVIVKHWFGYCLNAKRSPPTACISLSNGNRWLPAWVLSRTDLARQGTDLMK